ncbi:hypothetical protein [Teredinibacter turnerae]|uniref:hypothetical protein n=1 Tax=Teredinibacter turnerae TaxID=2426 RepID=UPI0003F9AF19|nr:hypothetical protein [Teredinibacter turnerae]
MGIVSEIPIESIDKRRHVLFNSLEFVFSQIENRYQSLAYQFLSNKEADQSVGVSLAWDIVDWSERLRKLLGFGAGLKKKDVWYTEILSHLDYVEDVRHFIQHFDRSINTNLEASIPPLGHVTALIPSDRGYNVKIMNAGSFYLEKGEKYKIGGFKVPASVEYPVDHISLFIGAHSVNLSELYRAVAKAKGSFIVYIQNTYIKKT